LKGVNRKPQPGDKRDVPMQVVREVPIPAEEDVDAVTFMDYSVGIGWRF
jgi:hypothetical protein